MVAAVGAAILAAAVLDAARSGRAGPPVVLDVEHVALAARSERYARHAGVAAEDLSAWGATGPWAGRRGFDSLVQCATGIADAA